MARKKNRTMRITIMSIMNTSMNMAAGASLRMHITTNTATAAGADTNTAAQRNTRTGR